MKLLEEARVSATVASLLALLLEPIGPGRRAASVLLLTYLACGALFILVGRRREGSAAYFAAAHAMDVAFFVSVTLVAGLSSVTFFILGAFVVAAAAHRWGTQPAMMTAVAGMAAVLGGNLPELPRLNAFVNSAVYVLTLGYVLGRLADHGRRLGMENAAIMRVLARAQAEAGFRAMLNVMLEGVLPLFGAREALLATCEIHTGRAYLWEMRPSVHAVGGSTRVSELAPSRQATYLFACPVIAWHWTARGTRAAPIPESFLVNHSFTRALIVSFSFPEEWTGRLFLLDPRDTNLDSQLRFLQTIVAQAGPALRNGYRMRRLHARAGAVERARVARELHDGVMQSLIGLEMQLDVLRRSGRQPPGAAEELGHIQSQLRQEALQLRELIEQVKPIDIGSAQLLAFLTEHVDKFRRQTGISATFIAGLDRVMLAPRTCSELARIVQEALVNVRKHSGARNVVVRFSHEASCWKLVIDDDGCGFSFSGRLTQSDLDALRKGPVVIKERVRAIGGSLAIESQPGGGARLEVTLPTAAYG